MCCADVDFSVGYDRGGELDSVSWGISGIDSTVVELIGQVVGIIGAQSCGGRGSDGGVLVLDRISVVDNPQDSVRGAVGRNECRSAVAAPLHGG